MRSLAKIIIFILIELLALCPAVLIAKAQDAVTITKEDIHDCFIYEDYVVEGIIRSVSIETIPIEDFNPNIVNPASHEMKTQLTRMEFEIETVLIGTITRQNIIVLGQNRMVQIVTKHEISAKGFNLTVRELKEGDNIIVALKFIERGNYNKDGNFLLINDASRFLIKDDTFLRGRKSDPIQRGKVSDLYKAIEEIKKMRSIESITDKAELIVKGKVKDRWTTGDTLSGGLNKNIVRIKLSVDECLKGDFAGDEMEFSVIYMATYNPFWKSRVPELTPGEDWLVFLKWAKEPGYYPFSGVNCMFEVDVDKLIRVNRGSRITLDRSLEEMKAVILGEVSGGDRGEE